MILGILPEQGGSIANLRRSGQDVRFIYSYLKPYCQAFEKVYYFSYTRENPAVPANCTVLPNPGWHRWLYGFLLPVIQRQAFQGCSVLRVMQATGAIPAQVARSRWGTPYAVTYGYRYDLNAAARGERLRAPLFRWRARQAARAADQVIVTTPTLAAYVSGFVSSERILLVPNGVDLERFRPAPVRPRNEIARVIYVGQLTPQKNLPMLLEAIRIAGRPLQLTLVGDGAQRQALSALAAQCSLQVNFAGTVPHDRLPALLAKADVFVLPSLGEGHPKALLEAMACGLPCLGTDVPGIRDIITSGENGLLSPLSPAGLAEGLVRLLADPALRNRLGVAARRHIEANYDLARLVQTEIAAMKGLVTGAR